jgi:hypothetical protein
MHTKWPLAWKISFIRIGWWHYALCIGLLGLWLMLSQTAWAERNYLFTAVRAASILVPLFAGMQAAYVFSPDDERPLEIMIVAPRPILWLIVERLIIVLGSYSAIGLATIFLTVTTFDTGSITPGDMLVWWLPPLIWFSGVGLYITMVTRQGMFGSLMVILIWGTSLVSSGGLPEKYLGFAPILPYLQRGAANITDELYSLNRFTLVAVGLLLGGLALRLALDEERLLGLKHKGLGTGGWRVQHTHSPLSPLPSPLTQESS